MTASFS